MAKAIELRGPKVPSRGPAKTTIQLRVNGADYEASIEPRRTLLDVLRKDLGLTGTKKACAEGSCGACTIILDGKAVYSCLTLAIECEGKEIQTIEGLAKDGKLHPIQQAFIESDALQCGFCTPGQIMSLKALFDKKPNATLTEIKRAVSGNLCRCGAYLKIFKAALRAKELLTKHNG